jgi:hypothetical protein
MTTITKDFDTYQIKYASRKVQTSSGLSTLYAVITCQSGTNHVQVGTIWFLDTPLQDSSYTNNIITMCLDISRFNDIVTLLRYEKPFRMYFDDSKKEASIQSFSHEAVGEQEGFD